MTGMKADRSSRGCRYQSFGIGGFVHTYVYLQMGGVIWLIREHETKKPGIGSTTSTTVVMNTDDLRGCRAKAGVGGGGRTGL